MKKPTPKKPATSSPLKVETVTLASLALDPRNARLHPDRNLDSIKASFKRFGQQKPIVVDADGVIVAGNGSYAAAKALGWKTIDVVRTALRGTEARAFAISDNRAAELAEWDTEELLRTVAEIREADIPLDSIGFDDDELARMVEAAGGNGGGPGQPPRKPSMRIEMRPLSAIRVYENNPRINDAAVDAVVTSIRQFGFRQPIVVDADGVIVVGHTRYKAAQKMGLAEVPVHVAADLTPAQAKAYRLADNATAGLAEWDYALLPAELAALRELDVDIATLGFGPELLSRIESGEANGGLTDPDEIPSPPENPVTKLGDLWILGDHRLLCGDSAAPADVDRLLDGDQVHLVNTDPPYNVKVEPRSNNAIAAGNSSFRATKTQAPRAKSQMRAKDRPLANDFVSDEKFDGLLEAWFGNIARVLVPGGSFYIWGGYSDVGNYPPFLKKNGLYFAQAIIWVKEHPVMSRKDFLGNHEWAFYGWHEGAGHKFYGPKNITDVWSVKKVSPQSMVHLTEKPTELASRAMLYSSLGGQNVLDLFGGSGSTLVAAEQTGRKSRLMELDPAYCDVIVGRYEKFTGKKAKRA